MSQKEPPAGAVWHRDEGPAARRDPPRDAPRSRITLWIGRALEPRVVRRIMVLYNRRGFRRMSRWPGLFSEFHSVLGALKFAEDRGAAGIRVEYSSPNYLDPPQGPNWWLYFFESALMRVGGEPERDVEEIHLNRRLARYGRYGGFCDLVNGSTSRFYPMTYGISRAELHRLIASYISVQPSIRAKVDAFVRAELQHVEFTVGVHYRGTDSARHYPYHRLPYDAFVDEIRRCLDRAAPRTYRIFVATDEIAFLERMRATFGRDVICWEASPRVHAADLPIHFNRTLRITNYQKGETALIDCLLLAATSYLVKGRSNLSDASLAFNPLMPYSFCLR